MEARGSETLQLSNGAEVPPIVHNVFEPSTGIWQYVVADPSTKRCIVIDPVRDYHDDETIVSTDAADNIIRLIQQHSYVVQLIMETNSTPSSGYSSASRFRSAAWYLRMQLTNLQGWAPQLSADSDVTRLMSALQRRHGLTGRPASNLPPGLGDGEAVLVGRMRVRCLHLPSYGTPRRRAFVVGANVFGAHSLAVLSRESSLAVLSDRMPRMDKELSVVTWRSMQKVLSYDEDVKVYLDAADWHDAEEVQSFHTVSTCRDMNDYIDLPEPEFLVRWEGQYRERLAELALRKRGKKGR